MGRLQDVVASERGSSFVEYLVLLGAFSLPVAGALLLLGPRLLHFYHHVQLMWSGPFP